MGMIAEIFVSLLGEVVDVRRPVEAEHLHDQIYRIVEQSYDRELETWEFGPGDDVTCEVVGSSGERILVATGLYRRHDDPR